MKLNFHRLIVGAFLYLSICLLANIVIKPFSDLNFLGPAAGIAGALAIIWGPAGIFSAVLGNLTFQVLQVLYFEQDINVALIFLSSLAILLQACWVRQLTEQSVKKQKWLNSQTALFKFILYIGPLASLVIGLSSLLIALLEVEQFNSPPMYTFVMSYAGSILVSVFAIPILLFLFGKQKLGLSKRIFLILSSLLGALAVSFLFYISQQLHQSQRAHQLERDYEKISNAIKNERSNINRKLDSMGAFFKSSSSVSLREFKSFAHQVYKEKSSVVLLQWAPALNEDNKHAFEEDIGKQLKVDYQITEQTLLGDIIFASIHDVYLPVTYIYPVNQYEMMYGLNLWNDKLQKEAISRAVKLRKIVASENFALNFLPQYEEVMLIHKPIFNVKNIYGSLKIPKQSPVSGFIVAMVKIKPFLSDLMALYPELNLYIEDASNLDKRVVYGERITVENRLHHRFNVDVFTRNWDISIAEKQPWGMQSKSWTVWLMIIGATLAGIFYQLLFLLIAAYSLELNYRVTVKTRNLILAKEKSEKESSAKTQFLHTLSKELRTPFTIIKRLTETFPDDNMSSQTKAYIANISYASLNIEQLIDTVNELSNIESGLVYLNHRPFDFSVFLARMKNMIKVSPYLNTQEIKIELAKNLPTFINSDELRLQKLFMMLVENVEEVLSSKVFCVSVNVHFHKGNAATIFFVVTHLDEKVTSNISIDSSRKTNFSVLNTRMAMLQELCVLFKGDLKLSKLPSGNLMISASVKINLHQFKNESLQNNAVTSNPDVYKLLAQKRILLVQENDNRDEYLCQNLLKVEYHVEVIAEDEDVLSYLEASMYHLVIFDCTVLSESMIKMLRQVRSRLEYKNLTLIGLVPTDITHDKVMIIQGYLTEYAFKPLNEERLGLLIDKY